METKYYAKLDKYGIITGIVSSTKEGFPSESDYKLLTSEQVNAIRDTDANWMLLLGELVQVEEGQLFLNSRKDEKIVELNIACQNAIISGFTSDALGTPHKYDSGEVDQLNIIGAAALNTNCFYKCLDLQTNSKEFRLHTAEQMKTVLKDGSTIKIALLQKCTELKSLANWASNITELEEIKW